MASGRARICATVAGIVAGMCLLGARANAALSVSLGQLSPGGTATQFGYVIDLAPVSDEIAPGDFFRVYDFARYIPGSASAPSGWTASISLSDSPPPGIVLLHGDDPTLDNLTFTYAGSTPILGGTLGLEIGPFSATTANLTPGPPPMTSKDFVASITNAIYPSGGLNGPTFVSEGTVAVPAPVPEPASLGLLALATPLLLIRRRAT